MDINQLDAKQFCIYAYSTAIWQEYKFHEFTLDLRCVFARNNLLMQKTCRNNSNKDGIYNFTKSKKVLIGVKKGEYEVIYGEGSGKQSLNI